MDHLKHDPLTLAYRNTLEYDERAILAELERNVDPDDCWVDPDDPSNR